MRSFNVKILDIASYLPPHIETNDVLLKDNPSWDISEIEAKTGIRQRHIEKNYDIIDMAELATKKVLDNLTASDEIDFLILVTQSAPFRLPSSSCLLHKRLGLKKGCMVYDVNLGCSGYVYALSQATALIASGIVNRGLIVCSEKYSQYISKDSRTCRPIFSDGAACTLIENSLDRNGVLAFDFGTDGEGFYDLIVHPDERAGLGCPGELLMNGSKVFLFTMKVVPECVRELLNKS
jgi:3-oxoacyl-[acyl-carrier-protein] synthase-3